MPKTVFLADLVYDTIKSNFVLPLNIAYIAASLADKYGTEIDIRLFKYPTDLERAILSNPPDVLGLSNYSWNARLNIVFLDMVKRLNPDSITVMGGPNIRITNEDIKVFLTQNRSLDYYILNEGEEPFTDLVGAVLDGKGKPAVVGCANLIDNVLHYAPIEFRKKPRIIDLPSPYLTGWLDPFLADRDMIPLLETNRGCPFGCAYCAWGIATLSAVRTRPIEVIFEEIDYIADKSAGQPTWIICDANFGILERDVKIAEKLRDIMKERKSPSSCQMWYSKNTPERNIRIADILGSATASYAIQSSDPIVLTNVGRGNISLEAIKKQLFDAKSKGIDVSTDLLVGLPGETAQSHLTSLATAFDLGYNSIHPYNIRMLPGSKYESDEFRTKYEVVTKYRPIFGSYGIYDGKRVVEVEESVRATKDMSEDELDSYKVHHWLIYFGWNMGFFKPLLQLGLRYGANPAIVLDEVMRTDNPLLKQTFNSMKEQSVKEWFNSSQEMIDFYDQPENYQTLKDSFTKLNFLFISQIYQSPRIIEQLQKEIADAVFSRITDETISNPLFRENLVAVSKLLICNDPYMDSFSVKHTYPGKIASIIANDPALESLESVTVEIYRPEQYTTLCRYHLMPDGKKDLSVKNFVRFLEVGDYTLKNKIRVAPQVAYALAS